MFRAKKEKMQNEEDLKKARERVQRLEQRVERLDREVEAVQIRTRPREG